MAPISAVQRGWGDPDAVGFSSRIVNVNAAGISVPVHKHVVGVFTYLFVMLARAYDLAGYGDDWGYSNRCIRGTGPGTDRVCVKSNHAWGLAVDADASVNPMTTDLEANHEFVRTVVDPILAPFYGRLLWGGEYAGARKDYMHFEYVGTVAEAIADSAHALRLLQAPEDNDMTPEQAKQLAEIHQMLTALVAARRADKTDVDPKHISLGDVLTHEEKQS